MWWFLAVSVNLQYVTKHFLSESTLNRTVWVM
jgi:hypothetical protein